MYIQISIILQNLI